MLQKHQYFRQILLRDHGRGLSEIHDIVIAKVPVLKWFAFYAIICIEQIITQLLTANGIAQL